MPESFVLFVHSLGECQHLADALRDAGEEELAEQFAAPIEDPEGVEEWGPLLSVDQMLELGEHVHATYGSSGSVLGGGGNGG